MRSTPENQRRQGVLILKDYGSLTGSTRPTSSEVLRRFRVSAQGSIFSGQLVTGPLLIDETNGVPVPVPPGATFPVTGERSVGAADR